MRRVTSMRLLVGGALLLLTWIVSPASSTPQQPPAARGTPRVADQGSDRALEAVNAEVGKLRARLAPSAERPTPLRNPFQFGRTAERRSPEAVAPTIVPVYVPATPPTLVAILSSDDAGTVTLTAVFSERDDLNFVKVGDRVGEFVVKDVTAEHVEVVEQASGASIVLSLR